MLNWFNILLTTVFAGTTIAGLLVAANLKYQSYASKTEIANNATEMVDTNSDEDFNDDKSETSVSESDKEDQEHIDSSPALDIDNLEAEEEYFETETLKIAEKDVFEYNEVETVETINEDCTDGCPKIPLDFDAIEEEKDTQEKNELNLSFLKPDPHILITPLV